MGADQSPTAIAKSAINLMLYGASTPHVFPVSDSVTAPALDRLRGSLQLILTNPPFGGGKYDDAEGLRRTTTAIPSLGSKGTIDPALACTVRALDLLAPDGVLGIVLPDGIVDGRHFDELIDRGDDLAVAANISLPTSHLCSERHGGEDERSVHPEAPLRSTERFWRELSTWGSFGRRVRPLRILPARRCPRSSRG